MTAPDPSMPTGPSTPPAPPVGSPGYRPTAAPRSSGTPEAGIVVGVMLVIVGGLFLAGRVLDITVGPDAWPLWIIVPGLAILAGSLAIQARGGLGLAIPGAIVTMVGLVLWVQSVYDLYATWAYAWALVAPTGPGLGMLLHGAVHGDRDLVGEGFRTVLVGLGLFLGFALFFEGVIGLSGDRVAGLDDALPFVLVGLGALMVVLSIARRGTGRTA
jgi:hypothetical protein